MDVSDVLRAANERIAEINRSFGFVGSGGRDQYLCECPDLGCMQRLELTEAESRAVRAHPMRFLDARGCVDERVDPGVGSTATAAVVERSGRRSRGLSL